MKRKTNYPHRIYVWNILDKQNRTNEQLFDDLHIIILEAKDLLGLRGWRITIKFNFISPAAQIVVICFARERDYTAFKLFASDQLALADNHSNPKVWELVQKDRERLKRWAI